MAVFEKDGKFYPDKAFSERAWIKNVDQYQELYQQSVDDPERFWRRIAGELFWYKKPEKIFDFNFDIRKGKIFHEWFKGGYTNICYNCIHKKIKCSKCDNEIYIKEPYINIYIDKNYNYFCENCMKN